jgi:Phosphotransacetylase
MNDRNYFGMMMVESGDADTFITGTYTKYSETSRIAKEVIGIREGYNCFGAMHIVNTKKGPYFFADTMINRLPSTETLIDITRLTNRAVKFFNIKPVMAMISFSNFGTDTEGSPASIHEVVSHLHENYPHIDVDGEMQVNFALDKELRDAKFPFSKLVGKDVNTLVFPNLSSGNVAYKLMANMGGAEIIGPIQMGLNKPIHFTDIESSVRDIVNLTVVSVLDALACEKMSEIDKRR